MEKVLCFDIWTFSEHDYDSKIVQETKLVVLPNFKVLSNLFFTLVYDT